MISSVASMIDQFNMPNICLMLDMGYEVHVACNFEQAESGIVADACHLSSMGLPEKHAACRGFHQGVLAAVGSDWKAPV